MNLWSSTAIDFLRNFRPHKSSFIWFIRLGNGTSPLVGKSDIAVYINYRSHSFSFLLIRFSQSANILSHRRSDKTCLYYFILSLLYYHLFQSEFLFTFYLHQLSNLPLDKTDFILEFDYVTSKKCAPCDESRGHQHPLWLSFSFCRKVYSSLYQSAQ